MLDGTQMCRNLNCISNESGEIVIVRYSWMVLLVLFVTTTSAGCVSGASNSQKETPAVESSSGVASPSSQPTASASEPSPGDVEACLVAWEEEKRASDQGVLDDATLRQTGRVCPDLDTWQSMRDRVGYGSSSPNLLRAMCAVEPDTPVCRDAREYQGEIG